MNVTLQPTASALTTSTPGLAEPPLRVLVADDNRDAAETLALWLEIEGYAVHTAHDGVQALALAQAFKPDVVLLDIGMPGLDGHAVAERLRQQPWPRPLLLVATTGWGHDEDRQRSRRAGFDVHLTKPVSPQAVSQLLAAHRRAQQAG